MLHSTRNLLVLNSLIISGYIVLSLKLSNYLLIYYYAI